MSMSGEKPPEPENVLPENSVLTLEAYLEMLAVLSTRSQFELVRYLIQHGEMSKSTLQTAFDTEADALESHLQALTDVGLVETRAKNRTEGALAYSYRATMFAEVLFEEGIEELLQRETDSEDSYSSSGGVYSSDT
ncbi:helix-turn-helix domain-containing protein [Halomicroarcula sp. F13]|uniref:Helix-turn-helix domain-containing protein n=1 Tax=Haloarcula rubra TaxID=2487747 RepID=A0AAW4PX35_9EURY|nr:helix-turn-helix domain-containing protein [Halomicroarcula rubra]MBX0325130.1 helix-turn-helix domain-containing protein [Halomicroarcula rubra]